MALKKAQELKVAKEEEEERVREARKEAFQERIDTLKQKEKPNGEEEEKDSIGSAIRIMQENKKREAFRDRTQEQLDNVRNQASSTRSRVRVKFPDGFVLAGSFGGRERVQAVIDFIQENLME